MEDTTTLTADMKFAQNSMPMSLCHYSTNKALHDAAQLAEFLQAAILRCIESELPMDDNEIMGMDQCFNLLRDKIEIGAGLYQFPQAGNRKDHKLCIRREV